MTRDTTVCLDAAAPLLEPRRLEAHIGELRSGGLDAVLVTVASIEDSRYLLGAVARWLAVARASQLPVRIATTAAEVRDARAASELAVVLHAQGGSPIEDDVDLLEAYHRLGVRVVQLTYNYRNLLGDGCFERTDAGLSELGRRVVRRLCSLGVVLDISHAGVRTSLEAVEETAGPVVATHANARAVCDHPRNLTDDQIRAVAESGGVVGLCAFPAFVTAKPDPLLTHLVDHAVYIGDLVGVEHVGMGLDFADETEDDFVYYGYDERYYPRPPWIYPEGIRGFADFRNLAAALSARGFAPIEVDGILGMNFLRVFERIWGG